MNLYRAGARTCSSKCRVRVFRAEKRAESKRKQTYIPAEMVGMHRWIRWSETQVGSRVTKVPKMCGSFRNASSTNPATWGSYEEAASSSVGDGMGFVLAGDGLACIDLDGCLDDGVPTDAAQAVLDMFPDAWVEISPSGEGLHIWGRANSQHGRAFVTADGLSVEFYASGRYMTVTGNAYRVGELAPDLDRVLSCA